MRTMGRSVALGALAVLCLGLAAVRLWQSRSRDGRAISMTAAEMARRVRDADERIAWQAVTDLGRLESREHAPALVEALRDPRPRLRAAAATALGRAAVWETIPPLLDALNDSDPEVRREAHQAIVRMIGVDYGFPAEGSPAARAAAIAVFRNQYGENRERHLAWLRRTGRLPAAEERP